MIRATPDYNPWTDLASRYDLHVGVNTLTRADGYLVTDHKAILLGDHLSRIEQAEALAHMLAHVDLKHRYISRDRPGRAAFVAQREQTASVVAASRLVDPTAMFEALRNNTTATGAAEELGVSITTLQVRHGLLSASDRDMLQRNGFDVEWPTPVGVVPFICGLVDLGVERAYRRMEDAPDVYLCGHLALAG